VIPGIIAFAVDFHTGAIYLPPDEGAGRAQGEGIHVDPDELTREKLAEVVREHMGAEVMLTERDMRVLRQKSREGIAAEVAKLDRNQKR